jgi:predicted RND superfamily exporter protein
MTLAARITGRLLRVYEGLVLDRPLLTLSLVIAVVGVFAWHVPDLRLDVSADSLILENDADLAYYRGIRAAYGGDSFVIVT